MRSEELAFGETVFAAGSPADSFYFVVQGHCALLRHDARRDVLKVVGVNGHLKKPRQTSSMEKFGVVGLVGTYEIFGLDSLMDAHSEGNKSSKHRKEYGVSCVATSTLKLMKIPVTSCMHLPTASLQALSHLAFFRRCISRSFLERNEKDFALLSSLTAKVQFLQELDQEVRHECLRHLKYQCE